jgi:pyruvate/2-oxoglutarate dehydrogenase complex dihydrolipoamide acyltransferase (E2) component
MPRLPATLLSLSCGSPPRCRRADGERSSSPAWSPRGSQSELGFRVPGKIVERLVDTGQTVRRGQPLMRIDAADYVLARPPRTKTVAAAKARAAPGRRRRGPLSRPGRRPARCRARPTTRSRPPPSPPAPSLPPPKPRPGCRATRPAMRCWSPTPTASWSRRSASPARSSPPARRWCAWPIAGPREATIALPETLRPGVGSDGDRLGVRMRPPAPPACARSPTPPIPATRTFEARYVLDGACRPAPLGATVTISLPGEAGSGGDAPCRSARSMTGQGAGRLVVDPKTSPSPGAPSSSSPSARRPRRSRGGLAAGERFVALGAHMLHQGQSASAVRGDPAQ